MSALDCLPFLLGDVCRRLSIGQLVLLIFFLGGVKAQSSLLRCCRCGIVGGGVGLSNATAWWETHSAGSLGIASSSILMLGGRVSGVIGCGNGTIRSLCNARFWCGTIALGLLVLVLAFDC